MKIIKYKKTFLVIMLSLPLLAIGQSYSNQGFVISNGGGNDTTGVYTNFAVIGAPLISSNIVGGNYSTSLGFLLGYGNLPVGIEDFLFDLPKQFQLYQNYPNPFNPITHIKFALPKSEVVKIEIFNILGKKVATVLEAKKPAGYHIVDYNANHLASGSYFYRIQTKSFSDVKRMIYLK